MIIDIEEGLLDLEKGLVNTLGVSPDIFQRDSGKEMLMKVAMIYARHIYHEYVNRGAMSNARIMAEIASELHSVGQMDAYFKAKTAADHLIRYEAAGENPDLDETPEAEAYFRTLEFQEESFREIEELVMSVFRLEGSDRIFKLSLPTGPAGHRLITASLIINDANAVRHSGLPRKVYNDMIRSIVLG